MKSVLAWSLLATAALAAPPFVLQGNGDAAPPSQPTRIEDLTVDDFLAVQDAFKDSFEHVLDEDKPLINEAGSLPHPPHHPLPPPVLDFSNYTVLEIVNATYGKHHECPHKGGLMRKIRKGLGFEGEPHHPSSPEHLPLSHLAWLLNFSPEAAELLEKDDITLLAPDNHALQNPHKRKEHGDKFANLDDAAREHRSDAFDFDVSAPHPFHARELSPKKLAALDDEDEDKKRIFKKIIAYVGKYHVLPGKWSGHELADRSTVPTLIEESRVRVEPTLDVFPFPHPSLKFNSYAHKRGPTILAKNGIIHLIGEPLLPPFTPLNQIFLAPKFFGLFTNALQKAGIAGKGDELLAPHEGADALLAPDLADIDIDDLVQELAEDHKLEQWTVFVPSNFAFARLPLKVAAFLHSPFPFAKKVLRYLLGYHVVPDLVFFTDYIKNGSSDAIVQYLVKEEIDVEVPPSWIAPEEHEHPHPHPHPHPPHAPEHPPWPRANISHYVLPTLLTHFSPNATLKVAVISHRFLGKGPIRRELIVFPSHRPHHKHGDDEDHVARAYRKFGGDGDHHDGPPHPHPVKVSYTDLPVRGGAVHVLGTKFLIPPPPPHHDDKDLEALAAQGFSKKEAKKLAKLLVKLSSA